MPSSFFDAIDDLPALTYLPDMAKLLSSASYPNAPSAVAANEMSKEQLFGGLIATSETTEDDEDESRPSKRSKPNRPETNEYSQDPPKRQRGRPKVSTKDETAAERRRTQIRLAQRAYRSRKENTIAELTQKVEDLQDLIKSLNSGFSKLRDVLLNTGMVHANSAVARQVDDLMQKLVEASENNPTDVEKTSEEEDEPHMQPFSNHQSGSMGGNMTQTTLQGQIFPARSGSVANIQGGLLDVGAGHNLLDLHGQSLTDNQLYPALTPTYPINLSSRTAALPFSDIDTAHLAANHIDYIERFPLKHSYTYSFQETTFARRLHRFCIERAFRRLTNPNVDPDWLLRTFRFTFNLTNKQRIIAAFKQILSQGTDEPLENWRTPYIHIGGAGLHFPRFDATGQVVYPPNLLDPVRASSPWRLPNVETPPSANNIDEILESIGFGGEWFDCHDVEEYLKTKGIFPDAQASFVVVDSALVNLPGRRGSAGIETVVSDSSTDAANAGQEMVDAQENMKFNPLPTIPDVNPAVNANVHDWLGQQQLFGANDFSIEFQSPFEIATRETKLLTIEIERFLERLSDESVCLGRAPGFRKEHVDNALVLAMQEAF